MIKLSTRCTACGRIVSGENVHVYIVQPYPDEPQEPSPNEPTEQVFTQQMIVCQTCLPEGESGEVVYVPKERETAQYPQGWYLVRGELFVNRN